ncbi:partitioning defective 3 homolog B-like [Aplochiton taeniatus]
MATQHNDHFNSSSLTRTVEISGEGGPLGIHVVPYSSSLSGRSLGLYIRGVEEASRSQREGLFEEEECIVSINEHRLLDYTFSQAQEVFRQAMRSPVVRLEVVTVSNRERYERSLIGQLFNPDSPGLPKSKEPPPIRAKPVFKPSESPTSRLAEDGTAPAGRPMGSPVSLSPAPRGQSDSPVLKKGPALSGLVATRKGGRKLKIDLKKGSEGLGFTVVTRDSSLHGPGPILVKNILPRGAAVKDGRLQSGDRILEVNGVDISGVGQEDLVSMLRSTRQGDSVSLLVLRQEDVFLPREMKEEPLVVPPRGVVSEDGKEQLMFEVPLNDTGSAGLGVSLKGNKSRETGEDLGIFIKSIIHGGAAHKDGRLRINDQMMAVNGETLLGCSNHVAMETLRRSMSHEGNLRGMIQLVVLRTLTDHQTASPTRSFDSSHGYARLVSPANGPIQPAMVANSIYEKPNLSNGSYGHVEEEEEEEELSGQEVGLSNGQRPYLQHSLGPVQPAPSPGPAPSPEPAPEQSISSRARGQQAQPQYQHIKASKSMDLLADESKLGSRAEPETGSRPPVELGPTLGLKKSSSLESLQTAMSEVRKNDLLPFHRPRANMVRGRGCNESFRAAIDKSYDGPAEEEDDDGSDQSSGRDTPASGSSHKGVVEAEEGKKDKRKKDKGKKKEKNKGKGKEKKKTEEVEETDKKTKKKGFALLRFAKRREEKKAEAKATLQRQRSDLLSEEELGRMKEERERIEAKHTELRERQSRDQRGGGVPFPDVEDDLADPDYARIATFRDRDPYPPPRPHPQSPPPPTAQPQHPPPPHLHPRPPPAHPGHHGNDPSHHLDGLYATVNKQRAPPRSPPPSSSAANDR